MMALPRKSDAGFTLIELLIVVAIIAILAMISIPNLINAQRKANYSRAASDTKLAVTQAIVYAGDRGVYPVSITVIRDAMLVNLNDSDPWGNLYVLSPTLTTGTVFGNLDDLYIYSKGIGGTGNYPVPFQPNTGTGGSVGYSSVYGAWAGS